MSGRFAKLRKLPDLDDSDFDFYDDPVVFSINKNLYKDMHADAQEHTMSRKSIFVIYPKDIEIIFGLSPQLAMQLLFEIREALAIMKVGPVTIGHFYIYTGIDKETINDFIEQS